MSTLYILLKAFLDPVVPVLILLIVGLLVSFRSEKRRSLRITLPAAFIILYMGSISPVSNALCYFLERDYLNSYNGETGKLDIVVVLGGGVSENIYLEETMPSYQTTSRLLHAVQVFNKSGSEHLVFMGKGAGKLSEAEVMKRSAERLGIPTASLMIDPNSRNTWEHAAELNKMFQDKDMRIGLVTSAYHMKRSEGEFRKYFQNIAPFPSDYLYTSYPISVYTFIPTSTNLHKFSVAFCEIIGIVWYKIKG